MRSLNLKPEHKAVTDYYAEIEKLGGFGQVNEGQVAPVFSQLLKHCARQFDYTLIEQYSDKINGHNLRYDGLLVDEFKLHHGIWEAKDTNDKLDVEIKKKFEKGYPNKNIMFQDPKHIVIYQNGKEVFGEDVTKPEKLIEALKIFFDYEQPIIEDFHKAVEQFKQEIPKLAEGLQAIIDEEQARNIAYQKAFADFTKLCQKSINPNIAEAALEEMLIQHLLTERLFRTVFKNPDFVKRNAIAVEIEKVIDAMTSRAFDRSKFTEKLDRFYRAIEEAAKDITDWNEMQGFMNTVYEKFFQGFAVKVADTHGIVYTPQPIVNFMVRSVEDILQREFGRSLSDPGVHILDPFVGTGNFIVNIMKAIRQTALPNKYASELHCNEVMLLPYYVACMNIEHEYYEKTGEYKPFEGICFVDTFQLAEPEGNYLFSMTEKNTERVEKQKNTPIFVIISNPPYNAGQVNENDNNKNRKYPVIDKRVAETYAKDSKATLVNQLYDPYVKAIRWASDRLVKNGEGIVAVVTNNSFLDNIAFDGMRKHLEKDFDSIYVLDLKGNIRKDSMRDGIPLGEKHTVFGLSAMVGISVSFFIKKSVLNAPSPQPSPKGGGGGDDINLLPQGEGAQRADEGAFHNKIYYHSVHFRSTREEKFELINNANSSANINWQELTPDKNHTWLTEGLSEDFENFIPIGDMENKRSATTKAIFYNFGRGVCTNNDSYVYNFNNSTLRSVYKKMVENYMKEYYRWLGNGKPENLDEFLQVDEKVLKWIRHTKRSLLQEKQILFDPINIRNAVYRPFMKMHYVFDKNFNEDLYQNPKTFPMPETETENKVICMTAVGNTKDFQCLITNVIADLHLTGDSQCFPFYTYNEENAPSPQPSPNGGGSDADINPPPQGEGATSVAGEGKKYIRRENITDWALEEFRKHYSFLPSPSGRRCHEVTEEGALKHPNIRTPEGTKESLEQKLRLIEYAQTLRSNQTDAEQKMWELLRAKRFMGLKFRRQHPFGKYILDFFCQETNLAIEIDGSGHTFEDKAKKDENRTRELEKAGIRVLRFWNNDVLNKTKDVVEMIWDEIQGNAPSPQPSPKGGGSNGSPDFGGSNDDFNLPPQGEGAQRADEGALKLVGEGHREITKWDIFYYIYGLLHHPAYRKEYEANLKRELPRIPFAPDFWAFSDAGKQLAELHVNYESQAEYPLKMIENPDKRLDWRVEKMRLSKDKKQLIYNDFLTLDGIPEKVFGYKLGNRSALDWIIDQYQVTTDKRSGITNDPNRDDEPDYIVKLIKKIVTVSIQTVTIVESLEKLDYK